MTAPELLVKLWAAGIELSADGHRLRCRARAGLISAKVVENVRAAKPALLPLVESQELAEHGLRRCAGCQQIQLWRHFDGAGDRCHDCEALTAAGSLFDQEE